MSTLKEQVIEKLTKIKELNNTVNRPLSNGIDIDKLAWELIELLKKKEIVIFEEVVCQCGDCKKKRDEWKM